MTQSSTADTPQFHTLDEARQWADAHYVGHTLRTGEPMRDHAEGIHEILSRLDVTDELHIAAYLFGYFLIHPDDAANRAALTADWGAEQAARVQNLHKIMEMGAKAWHNAKEHKENKAQKERSGDISKSERMQAEQNLTEQIER